MRKSILFTCSTILAVGLAGMAFAQEPLQEEQTPSQKTFPAERIFDAIDTDRDGVISKEEFQTHFEKAPMRFARPHDGGRGPMKFDGHGPRDFPRGDFQRGGFQHGPKMGRGPHDGGRGPGMPRPNKDVPPLPAVAEETPE